MGSQGAFVGGFPALLPERLIDFDGDGTAEIVYLADGPGWKDVPI
jgi:hypothetical protein